VYAACLCADADNFSSSEGKTFCLASFLAKKRLRGGKLLLIFSQESSLKKKFFFLG
jgi:hypothetical protein